MECVLEVITTSSGKGCGEGLILLNNFPGILSQIGWVGEEPEEGPEASQLLPRPQNQADSCRAEWDDSDTQLSEILSVHTHVHAHRPDEINLLAQRGGSLRKRFSKSFLWPGRVIQGGLARSLTGLVWGRTEMLPAVNQFLEAEHFWLELRGSFLYFI